MLQARARYADDHRFARRRQGRRRAVGSARKRPENRGAAARAPRADAAEGEAMSAISAWTTERWDGALESRRGGRSRRGHTSRTIGLLDDGAAGRALGRTRRSQSQGLRLAHELRRRLSPGQRLPMERVEVCVKGPIPGAPRGARERPWAGAAAGGDGERARRRGRLRARAPPHSPRARAGIHQPSCLDIAAMPGKRSIGVCAYHVWHPEGRAFDAAPLTRFEEAALSPGPARPAPC